MLFSCSIYVLFDFTMEKYEAKSSSPQKTKLLERLQAQLLRECSANSPFCPLKHTLTYRQEMFLILLQHQKIAIICPSLCKKDPLSTPSPGTRKGCQVDKRYKKEYLMKYSACLHFPVSNKDSSAKEKAVLFWSASLLLIRPQT